MEAGRRVDSTVYRHAIIPANIGIADKTIGLTIRRRRESVTLQLEKDSYMSTDITIALIVTLFVLLIFIYFTAVFGKPRI